MSPVRAPRSLRGHGTVTTVTGAAGPGAGSSLAARISVGVARPRSEPSGEGPPVTVMRRRASVRRLASITSRAARRNAGPGGMARPMPEALRVRRS